jgi:hypothetical protein
MKPSVKTVSRIAGVVLTLGVVWLLNANSKGRGDESGSTSSGSACDVCQEMMIGSFSCAVQGGEVVAQVNFQGSGDLTPSATGAGTVVLAGVPGDNVSRCESLTSKIVSDLDDADCALGRILSPAATQQVFSFSCHGNRSSLVNAMGEVSKRIISLSP